VIDPSVRAVLRSRYTIHRFFLLFGAIFVAALAALWVLELSPEASSMIGAVGAEFLRHLAADDAIVIVTYSFYLFVTPPGLRDAHVIPLRSGEIADGIVDLPVAASDYWFWGRSGTYFRSTVLPKLDEAARKERRHTAVGIVVPDPDEPGNSMRYASMKRGLGEEAEEHTLAANILATVTAAVVAAARNPYLHVSIGLCATVPVLRYDISSAGALVTRDAVNLPAILVNAGNPYFEMFRDAVENELAQSRRVTWDESAKALREGQDVSVGSALPAINGLANTDPAVVATAEALRTSKKHRYAPVTVFTAARAQLLSKINRDAR